MKSQKNLGIWMDHSTANFIQGTPALREHSNDVDITADTKEESSNGSEHTMHNKEQQMHEAFYKEISEEILKYDHVLIFGPTNAKSELHNYLKKDSHFNDITIEVESADKMTDNEKDAFVKNHFDKQSN
ncbi:hypothetical protein SYJ56_08885 [Algoriphagus sp. D3-2-R+10]|uniref:hypothetical protein n=1 Tax=Algoriphagus aurantiacus TaxID=3103948 RepID=UPI002B3E0240|nr:hypothetical protein [Algoriphagus sp. D3-2-R+10]MEB2775421.1 hypothetical protein [Algoriphagus sp. D3-2-R+10]